MPEPCATPEKLTRVEGGRLTIEVRFPPGVVLAPPPNADVRFPPSAKPRCPRCGAREITLTTRASLRGRSGVRFYYRCQRCVDPDTMDYTRFKRIRLGVLLERRPRVVLGADPG